MVKLYGWRAMMLKGLKSIVYSITSFRWEKCYLMSRVLDKEIQIETSLVIRKIGIEDYDSSWRKDYINNKRYSSYIERFKRDDTLAIGAFFDGVLAYSTWILFDGIEVDGTIFKKEGYGMLWDSYCLPKYRGNGLHNIMNAYSLNLMKHKGINNACVIILSHNIPAYKTQVRCGMEIIKVFYTYCFLRKKYSTLQI